LNARAYSVLAVIVALALAGCYRGSARTVSASDVSREQGWQLANGVPLIRQSSEHACGAAALAMVFQRWGIASGESEVVNASGAHDQPIAAGTLRDLARRKGLHAFLIQGEVTDLVREVGLDRPVLVGLVQRYTSRSYSHYEVVVGINQLTRRVLMLDPGRGMREDGFDSFATEWGGAGRLTLVVGP
jgi:ABC-type bacteriocin/lantibiotic exporter with double-glycine peptidase domain